MTTGVAVKVQKQRLWLKRNANICKLASWRPQKRYRGSARKWLSATDNQWKVTVGLSGWKHFIPNEDKLWQPTNWRKWPHSGLGTDCGADAMSALCSLEYKFKANVTRFLDEAHQKHRAMDGALNQCGLKALWIMNVVSLNVNHGPWADDHRWAEVRDLMRKRCNVMKLMPEQDALLDEYTPRIHEEMVLFDHAICSRSDRDSFVRDAIVARNSGQAKKGYQCNFNRFLGSFHESNSRLGEWTTTLYERSLVGLEGDMMKGTAFKKMLLASASVEMDGEDVGSTHIASRKQFIKDMKDVCQNALVCSVMFLQDSQNRNIVAIIGEAVKAHMAWHTDANLAQRNGKGSHDWLMKQNTGGYIEHLNKCKQGLLDVAVLTRLLYH